MARIFVVFVIICLNQFLFAHKVGNSNWCLRYTSTHLECVYAEISQCEDVLKSVEMFAKKNPTLPVVKGETQDKKIELVCIRNLDAGV